jgi:hypothetical protein
MLAEPQLRVRRPSGQMEIIPLQKTGPGRHSAEIVGPQPGPYAFSVAAPQGIATHLHLRQPPRELDRTGPSPEVDDWVREGLAARWSPEALDELARASASRDASPLRALLLALLLFCAGMLVDRAGPIPSLRTGRNAYFARRRA